MTPHPGSIQRDTRIRLIESGIRCFASHGFEGSSTREIARGAGANPCLLSYHFGGKEGLYLEAVRYILQRKASHLSEVVSRLPKGGEAPRQEVLRGLSDYIRTFVVELMAGHEGDALNEAAMILMAREMQSPRSETAPLLSTFLGPILDYLDSSLRALRPDLDEEALFAMSLSIHGQLFQLRNAAGAIRFLRNRPAFPEDLAYFIQHFIDFSLRGLGVPEASAPGSHPSM